MTNEAMFYNREKLNPFTAELKARCERDGEALVELRDGVMVKVTWVPRGSYGEDDPCYDQFRDTRKDSCLAWYADGSSFTSSDFDIVRMEN